MATKRINISEQHLQLLQELANYEGHGVPSAALATLVTHGLPLYLANRSRPSTQTIAPAALVCQPVAIVSEPEPRKPKPAKVSQSKAEALGFLYTGDNGSALVDDVLGNGSLAGYSTEPKGTYAVPDDDSIVALAGAIDNF